MNYNTLLTAENLEQLHFQSDETQKLLASQIAGITDVSSMMPALLSSNYELGGMMPMPSPETDSLISSPSLSNPDEELDLFALQPSIQEQNQLLSGIPVGNQIAELSQAAYEKNLMNLIANNQLQTALPVCDPLMSVSDDSLALNFPGMLPLKSQSPVMNTLDLTTVGLNDLSVEALDQLLNPTAGVEIPSLVPSTVEPTIGPEMIDPLLIGANNPYLMNELVSTNKMNAINGTYLEQMTTPPHSPVNLEALSNDNEFAYIQMQSPVDIPDMDFINATAVATPTVQPVVLNNVTPTVPSQKVVPMISNQIPTQMFTPELEKKVQPVLTKKRSLTKTNYTYVPVTKKRSNSDLKGAKIERSSSTKASQKKAVPMVKEKSGKIQKQQVKHTFVIETPGINYGKKTSGRKRKCKKSEEDEIINNLPQVPQVPCRPSVAAIPPQKLSKIHARTTEDLDSLIYQCEFCPSAFSRKHDLKRHIKIHTNSTPAHKCSHCGKSYARADALAKHEAANECQK